jgi:galactonate dehydratase
VDIVQPDVSHAGGIWETRKIAAMAEAYDVALAPHCPLGPVALAACMQVDFCTPNAFIQEQSLGIHYHEKADLLDYVANREIFRFDAGFVPRPTGPGLGIDIEEDRVREAAVAAPEPWRNPTWRVEDGSLAEW